MWKWQLGWKCHCSSHQPFQLGCTLTWNDWRLLGLKIRADTPNLDYTKLCCGGTSPPPLKVSGQHVWGYPDMQVEKGVAAGVRMTFLLCSLYRTGAMSFAISVLAWDGKGCSGMRWTPVCMAWNGENQNVLIFHLTPLNTCSDSSRLSYPLQDWERAKEIYSPVSFYTAWVNNNIVGDSLQMFCLAWMNS